MFLSGLDLGRRVSRQAEAWTDGPAVWGGCIGEEGAGHDVCCRKRDEFFSTGSIAAGPNGLSVLASSQREAVMASSTTATPFLTPPLEQLQHLAEELRSLLPRVRGELWESAPRALGREVGRQVRAPLTCLLLLGWSGIPQVGEAQETAEEFNREMFWRRLSECFCHCGLFRPLPVS